MLSRTATKGSASRRAGAAPPCGPAAGQARAARCAAPLQALHQAAAAAGRAQEQRRQQLARRRGVVTRVASDDEDAPPAGSPLAGFAMAEADYGSDEMTAADIKAALLDSLYGTERGLAARSEVRAEINELIAQLEAKNPTPSPTEMMSALNGDWKLVYTSNSELLAVLALSRLPFVTIGDITQRIDAATSTVENKVQISVPLSRTSFSTTASFEVRSPKRIAVHFERGAIATPQLLDDITIPDSVTVLGQSLDLAPLRGVLDPVNENLKGLLGRVGGVLSGQPDLSFPLPEVGGARGETWLLTTYLDDDTRITRGDRGSVFILVKEVSIATPSEIIEPPSTASAAPPAAEAPAGYV